MRLKHLVGLLKRTAEKVEVIAVQRLGWPTQLLPIAAVIAMVEHDDAWIGVGPKRKLDAVVYDPPPTPDPERTECWATGGTRENPGGRCSVWVNVVEGQGARWNTVVPIS